MRIGGWVKNSFVDYPGKIASVIFTQGCNLNCSYCHNTGLISCEANPDQQIQKEEVLNWLSRRRDMVDAVVISGGEPTMQDDLHLFLKEIKAVGFFIKLDTNGTNPERLRTLMKENLVDFIAMDLKAPLNKYEMICRTANLNLPSVRNSVKLIQNSGLDYEFRTTLCRELEDSDVDRILSDFGISSDYVLQHCRSNESTDMNLDKRDVGILKTRLKQTISCSFRGFE